MYPNIEAERARLGLSREEFAEVLGITPKTYYNWQKGITAIPSTALKKISEISKQEIGYLLEEKESEGNNPKAS